MSLVGTSTSVTQFNKSLSLQGFIDAGGKFHDTEFYKACTDESDCVFFLMKWMQVFQKFWFF